MHPCFEIDELLVTICSYLQPKELLSFALTCSRFTEPSLSTLWRISTHDLSSCFRLFPADAWRISEHPLADITLRRPIVSSDWEAVVRYARYVHALAVGRIRHDIDDNFFSSAAAAFNDTYAFPSLRRLDFLNPEVDSCIPFTKILLPPTLTHLSLSLQGSTEALTLLSQIGAICPSIGFFTCIFSGDIEHQSAFRQSLSDAIVSLKELKELSVPALTNEAISHLSRSTTLSSLTIRDPLGVGIDNPPSFAGLRSLRQLRLLYCRLDYVLDSMRKIQPSVLKETEVAICRRSLFLRVDEWVEYFTLLVQRANAAETLSIHICSPGHAVLLWSHVLQPLLMARNLIYLSLPNFDLLDLQDEFIEQLTRASPQLTRLIIGTANSSEAEPTLTLNSYLFAMKNCPRLVELGLFVDTSDAPEWLHDKPGQGKIQLRGPEFSLFVGGSTVDSPCEVAAFLSAFFYDAINIIIPLDAGTQHRRSWGEVEAMLPVLIYVRRQEQKLKVIEVQLEQMSE